MKFTSSIVAITATSACLLALVSVSKADSYTPFCVCEDGGGITANPDACSCNRLPGTPILSLEECCDSLKVNILASILAILSSILDAFLGLFGGGSNRRGLAEVFEKPPIHVLNDPGPIANAQVRPAFDPQFEGAITLDDKIGLWELPNFLSPEEVDEMLQVIQSADEHSYDCKADFCLRRPGLKTCIDDPTHESLVQPYGKQCLMLSENILELFSEDDQAAWAKFNAKSKDVWPNWESSNPLVYQKTGADIDPFKYHIDGFDLWEDYGRIAPVTTIIYLTSGGSKLVFPHGNDNHGISITPKAGTAITWYNIGDKDIPLLRAIHGVQATGNDHGPRIAIQDKFIYAPEVHATYGYKTDEVKL